MTFDLPACCGCGTDVFLAVWNSHTCPTCGVAFIRRSDEARQAIHKARNSGNAAEAYECCRQALINDPWSAVAWAERFRISFWLNTELNGNSAKMIAPPLQSIYLEHALIAAEQTAEEPVKQDVARVIIRFYISEFILDQLVRSGITEAVAPESPATMFLAPVQRFLQALPAALQLQLQEELIELTGESLNKSLSATCRTNHKRQNFLNLCACLTVPGVSASPLYIGIYETLESMIGSADDSVKRTGFLCLVSSNHPDAGQENVVQSQQRITPNYQINNWPLGVQVTSGRIPETLLSAWLLQWMDGYRNYLGINAQAIHRAHFECMGSSDVPAAQLDAFCNGL